MSERNVYVVQSKRGGRVRGVFSSAERAAGTAIGWSAQGTVLDVEKLDQLRHYGYLELSHYRIFRLRENLWYE